MEIYVDGTYQPLARPAIRATDRGLRQGEAVYEGVKIVARRPLFLEEHLDRLSASAHALELPMPWRAATLRPVLTRLLAEAGEVGLHLGSAALATGAGAAPATAGAAAAGAAAAGAACAAGAAVPVLLGPGQVLDQHVHAELLRQAAHQWADVTVLPADVVDDGVLAVEQDLDVQHLQRQAEGGGPVAGGGE